MSAIAVSNTFDWKSPNYLPVFQRRFRIISSIRKDPSLMPALLEFYRAHPAQFISDFGNTQDPRNIEKGLPSATPFVLFPKQVECVNRILESWRAGEPLIIEKSRDCGLSWLTIALAGTLCLFHPGMVIGFGSRKEEYVDKIGAPKSLFEKERYFMTHLPPEFTGDGRGINTARTCAFCFLKRAASSAARQETELAEVIGHRCTSLMRAHF